MKEKTCPICKVPKDLSEYDHYWSKERNKYRPQNYCRDCQKEEKKRRSADYFQNHRDERLQYARNYRADPKNKEKRKVLSQRFKVKYRAELKDCYVRDALKQRSGIPNEMSRAMPEIVEAKRLQLKIKRKIKELKNGKE